MRLKSARAKRPPTDAALNRNWPTKLPVEDITLNTLIVWDILAPRAGFEPATIRLTVECSTAELPRNRAKQGSRRQRITKPPRLAKEEMGYADAEPLGDEKARCHRDLLSPLRCEKRGLAGAAAIPRRNHAVN